MKLSLGASLLLGLLAACSSTPSRVVMPGAPEPPVTTLTSGEAPRCEVSCETPRIALEPGEAVDVHAAAVANVDRVFAGMHDDLLACYRARLAVDPTAHAFLTIDMVLGPDGNVRTVETTGGARLGDKGLACIVRRVKAATFDPIPGGGTRHVQVPLTLRRLGDGESI
jgi:hypothetical protein